MMCGPRLNTQSGYVCTLTSFMAMGPDSLEIVLCSRPYFSGTGIGSGNIAYIKLFQRNSIILLITSLSKPSLMFHNHVKNVKTLVRNVLT